MDDFYEEDEPIEDIKEAWTEGEKGTTAPPETTATDLENGIFSLLIAYIQSLVREGQRKEDACEQSAQLLERYAQALRSQMEEKEE